MPDKKPPMKRSITPQDIRTMREEVKKLESGEHAVISEREAEEYLRRIPTIPPPRTPVPSNR